MNKYRKKAVEITAVQWFPNSEYSHPGIYCDHEGDGPYVVTIHGERAHLAPGDWILPEPDGKHFYPCKPDIFEATYEPIEEAQ